MKYAMDCEMVGCGNKSVLAKVTIVDENGRVVLDTFVKPTEEVTDYRSQISGIGPSDLSKGQKFNDVKNKVISILNGNILIGHSLKFDLQALNWDHPEKLKRDLAEYPRFQSNNQPISLKELAATHLGRNIQHGVHNSVEDARASMEIYLKFANEWEKSL